MSKRPKHPTAPVAFNLGRDPSIELGALLKFAGVCESGGEAKHFVQSGSARVNGQVEVHRGRKLVVGDRVEARGKTIVVQA